MVKQSSARLDTTLSDYRGNINVFYSSAISGDISRLLGTTHYSYRFAEAKFLAVLHSLELTPVKLDMPEYYGSARALGSVCEDPTKQGIHLIFRSTEEIRLLKGAYNIACFAWEFENLRDFSDPEENPLRNQKRMLSLCHEIWAPSSYTQAVLQRYDLQRVRRVPAPISAPDTLRMTFNQAAAYLCRIPVTPLLINAVTPRKARASDALDRTTSMLDWLLERRELSGAIEVFLTILNPQDHRKNIDTLLRGFDYYSKTSKSAVLIVKLVTSRSRVTLPEAATNLVFEELQGGTYLNNPSVVFCSDYLSETQMDALYSITDFYVSASLAEGQNLPLQEAMLNGALAVSTRNTAMKDYIDSENSVIIETTQVEAEDKNLAGFISGHHLKVDLPSVEGVFNALCKASALNFDRRQALVRLGQAAIRDAFGSVPVGLLIQDALQNILNVTRQRDRGPTL